MATGNAGDSRVIWMDGELVPFEQANVHVLSHSLHYGSAAFEGIRAYKTKSGRTAIFKARDHMQRLHSSLAVFGGVCAYSVDDLIAAAVKLIKANELDECYVRPIAYIGNETRGLKLPANPQVRVAIATWRWGKYLGETVMQKGIRVGVASFRRPDSASAMPWAKLSGNYLNSIFARREATLRGVDEAILLDQLGFVAEGSGENIFIVQGGELLTPETTAILPGLTRGVIFDIARAFGYTVRETRITRNQLYRADEAFFTGTAAEVTPIAEVDGLPIGTGKPGTITKRLAEAFERCVRGDLGEIPAAKDWLTYV